MRLTRLSLFASLWLLCVGLVSTAAWYAINSAGHSTQVLTSASSRSGLPRASERPPAPATTDAPVPSSSSPTDEPSQDDPTTEPSQDEPTSPSTTSSSSTGPVPARTTSSRPVDRPRTPRTPRSSSTSDTPTPDARTVLETTGGGSVTVTCRAQDPIDFNARPADGWQTQTGTRGDFEADVRFSEGGDTWEVHALCVNGVPQTSVEHKHKDD